MSKKVFWFLIGFVFLFGCTGMMRGTTYVAEEIHIIKNVPFYEDKNNQCGPSSLASVINYWQTRKHSFDPVTPRDISSKIYSEGARGTLGIDLEFYARGKGFHTIQYSGSIEDIKKNIVDGNPIIILVDFGFFFYQKNHFMVVTGYSSDGIIVHSGSEEKFISFDNLEKIWGKTRFWTLIVKPSY